MFFAGKSGSKSCSRLGQDPGTACCKACSLQVPVQLAVSRPDTLRSQAQSGVSWRHVDVQRGVLRPHTLPSHVQLFCLSRLQVAVQRTVLGPGALQRGGGL